MLIGDFPKGDLAQCMRAEGVHLATGAFTVHVHASVSGFVDEFAAMYADFPVEIPRGIDDARLRVAPAPLVRRLLAPKARVWRDDGQLMGEVPAYRAFTLFETSLNWSIALSEVAPMLLHAAVLERDGRALLMPATSGSGKSTLCAALAWRGWRLFSDEVATFCWETGRLRPNPRPISLKNDAIRTIAEFEPRAVLSRVYEGTPKGSVAYMRPPREAVQRAQETAEAALVVAPRYVARAPLALEPLSRADGFQVLTDNSVNYTSMLQAGFDMLVEVAERCAAFRLTYSDLDEAIDAIDRLHLGWEPGNPGPAM